MPRQGPRSALVQASFDHSQVSKLRRTVTDAASRVGLSGRRLQEFVLAVNEIVTNAVRHGGGRGRLLLWRRAGTLVCEVSDEGTGMPGRPTEPDRLPPPVTGAGGRGLFLAGRFAELEVQSGPRGTTVVLSVPLNGG